MIKKVFYILFSVFLAYRSIELVRVLNYTAPAEFSAWVQLVIALVLNLFITGVFAFAGFAFTTSRIMPKGYYRIKHPKTLAYLYNILGVRYFKAMLLLAFWGKEKNRKRYFDGTKSGIDQFDIQTRQSEIGHLGALIAIGLVSMDLLLKGHVAIFIYTTVINFIANLYPIILQRIHRMQIERIALLTSQRKV